MKLTIIGYSTIITMKIDEGMNESNKFWTYLGFCPSASNGGCWEKIETLN